jgi:hypothetical protein
MRFFLKLLYSEMQDIKTEGSRAEVMHGTAKRTSGGLMKKDLKYNKWGSIVSKKKSEQAKKNKHLEKAGWTAKKGKFGAVRMAGGKKTAKKHYKKGSKSKTHKGEKDFTTKKSSKVFHRKGHYQKHAKGSKKVRAPYHKKGGNIGDVLGLSA